MGGCKKAFRLELAQIDTEYGTVTWTSGDPDEDTFFATNEDGEEIEVDYSDIVRFHNDKDGSIYDNLTGGVLKNLGKSDDLDIMVKDGRYGIYVTNGKVNVTLPKDIDNIMILLTRKI